MEMFVRYGVKRTTMNDIAAAAGIARQTLYNVYAGKDELLCASIQLHVEQSLASIEAELADVADLGDQLDIVFKHLVILPYEMIHSTPHGDELISGFCDVAQQELDVADERYKAILENLLLPYQQQIGHIGLNPEQLADLVNKSWKGCKYNARDKEHLLELLTSLKLLVLAAVER